MSNKFPLPEILIAERIGRAAACQALRASASLWRIVVDDSPLGGAGCAAARLLACLGAEVEIVTESGSVDCEVYRAMFTVAGSMDLPLTLCEANNFKAEAGRGGIIFANHDPLFRRGSACPEIEITSFDSGDAWRDNIAANDKRSFVRDVLATDKAISCNDARKLDQEAVKDYELPSLCLMENAGIGAAACAASMLKEAGGKKAVLVAGRGNNGGDALVVARGLLEMGLSAETYLLCNRHDLRGDALSNAEILSQAGVELHDVSESTEKLEDALAQADLIVDGVLGTGLSGEAKGLARQAIGLINNAGKPVLALDIPSGLHGDTGEVLGEAVKAAATVTFGGVKRGLRSGRGAEYCGRLYLALIGAPGERP